MCRITQVKLCFADDFILNCYNEQKSNFACLFETFKVAIKAFYDAFGFR